MADAMLTTTVFPATRRTGLEHREYPFCSECWLLLLVYMSCCLRAVSASLAQAEPLIFLKVNATAALPAVDPGGCQVLFLSALEDVYLPNGQPIDISRFDAVLTDAHDLVPWASAQPPLHFLDSLEYPQIPQREVLERKKNQRTLSFLVPRHPESEELARWTKEALEMLPGDVFVDDGTPSSRLPALKDYAFCVLLSITSDPRLPPEVLLESVAYGTVPLLVFNVPHFLNYTVYFPYMVGKFRPEGFTPHHARSFVQKSHEDALYVMQNSLMLVQDFFQLRYSLTFHWRLRLHATRLCEDAARPPPLRTHVFVAIYSAKPNFARRRAVRETWLSLLANRIEAPKVNGKPGEPLSVSYRFFLNAVGAGDPFDSASSAVDDSLRAEFEVFGDLVFLEALEEYPIGNMGRLALHWIANHTAAPYILKVDDDMYIRPLPLLRHLVRQQRAMMYWGFFERSGAVVRDPGSAHYLGDDLFGHDGVFPPYARGAALAMSLDLLRLIVHFDRRKAMRRLKVEDASYGYFIWQLTLLGVTAVTLSDRSEVHFSMDAKCCTEKTHPNNCWSPLSDSTWLVHHVGPKTVRCMFRADVEAGYYVAQKAPASDERKCGTASALSALLPGDDVASAPDPCNLGYVVEPVKDSRMYDPEADFALASLCGCVDTPPPHPDRPLPGPLYEDSSGPWLHSPHTPAQTSSI